jgi:hypothetical protein
MSGHANFECEAGLCLTEGVRLLFLEIDW